MRLEAKMIMLWLIVTVYLISPVDFFPGPIDDIIAALLAAMGSGRMIHGSK